MKSKEIILKPNVDDIFNTNDYFSLSRISKRAMEKHGLHMSIKELQELARNSPPVAQIPTGKKSVIGHRKLTNIYKYDDFK